MQFFSTEMVVVASEGLKFCGINYRRLCSLPPAQSLTHAADSFELLFRSPAIVLSPLRPSSPRIGDVMSDLVIEVK